MSTFKFQSATAGKLTWAEVEPHIDIAAVATNLFGPAAGRRGAELLWPCPWHEDRKPSFAVNPSKRRAFCNPCGLSLDAPALVMRVRGIDFPAAVRFLAELAGVAPAAPRKPPPQPPRDYIDVAREAYQRLWTPAGRDALDYLASRGLSEQTIRSARLGFRVYPWTWKDKRPNLCVPAVTIPWFDRGTVPRIKIRRLDSDDDKCRSLGPSKPPMLYPEVAIAAGSTVVVVEGELDALLLGQALAEVAAVVTLGAAQAEPDASTLDRLLCTKAIFAAQDADEAGDAAAAKWTALRRSIVRVRPPAKFKDWTDAHLAGCDLLSYFLEQIISDDNRYDFLERAAIMEFDSGLDRRTATLKAYAAVSRHKATPPINDQTPAPPAAIEPSPVSAPSASDPPSAAAGSSRFLPIDACKPMNYCGR